MADTNQVVVEAGNCTCHTVHIAHIHHRNFPEIWAECETAAEGATRLSNLLSQELKATGDNWHRESIELAVADVQAYIDALDGLVEGTSVEEHPSVDPDPTAATRTSDRVGNS